ncbi:hypothetical protein MY1884_007423 [Beauveria asiatica]
MSAPTTMYRDACVKVAMRIAQEFSVDITRSIMYAVQVFEHKIIVKEEKTRRTYKKVAKKDGQILILDEDDEPAHNVRFEPGSVIWIDQLENAAPDPAESLSANPSGEHREGHRKWTDYLRVSPAADGEKIPYIVENVENSEKPVLNLRCSLRGPFKWVSIYGENEHDWEGIARAEGAKGKGMFTLSFTLKFCDMLSQPRYEQSLFLPWNEEEEKKEALECERQIQLDKIRKEAVLVALAFAARGMALPASNAVQA